MDADELLMIVVEGLIRSCGGGGGGGGPRWRLVPLSGSQPKPSSSHSSASPADNRPSFPASFAEQSCTGNDTLNSESSTRLPAVMNDMFLLKFPPKNFFDMIESV